MTYRRDSERQRSWRVWIDLHRDTLVRCNLPEFVFSEEERWFRFLEHDGWDQETGWKIEMLPPAGAAAFYDLLLSEHDDDQYPALLRNLARLLGNSSHE